MTALEDISFSLRPGSITALLGANGSGKSTLFSVLLGLVTPSAGEVHLFGERPAAARRHNRVSYVPQQDAVDMAFPITVEEVVMQGRFAHQGLTRRPSAADRAAAEQALADVSLLELRQRGIGQLSGGSASGHLWRAPSRRRHL
ncbi:ATP-binding cassette domain-containing protein [Nesterenkonia pannonica]|uniref:metal ABC transporter ATP-binding protein n=1 Tax=Nesterenkonia pannonica TaxID=1548602 RepID=UPI00216489C7|nr:ATP-binding cassette domain-containing protein [Nesterenkonia pannonica]